MYKAGIPDRNQSVVVMIKQAKEYVKRYHTRGLLLVHLTYAITLWYC